MSETWKKMEETHERRNQEDTRASEKRVPREGKINDGR